MFFGSSEQLQCVWILLEGLQVTLKICILLLLFKDILHYGYIQKIKVKEKCLLYTKDDIKYQGKGSTPLFHTTYKHLKHE